MFEKEAENFIIERYELDKCYRVDTEETRQYMGIDVHTNYENEYQCYLAGLKAGSQLDKIWYDYDAGEDCYEDTHEGRWVERGYNKANEWHYVKDKLPPVKKEYNGRSELVLVLSKEKEMQYAQYVEKEKTWARGICEINFKPYAWKEIVLPELPKELDK